MFLAPEITFFQVFSGPSACHSLGASDAVRTSSRDVFGIVLGSRLEAVGGRLVSVRRVLAAGYFGDPPFSGPSAKYQFFKDVLNKIIVLDVLRGAVFVGCGPFWS